MISQLTNYKRTTYKRTIYRLLILLLVGCCLPVQATELIGRWVLDQEGTAAIQPEQPQEKNWLKNQNISTNVSVGGMPLPNLRSKVGPVDSRASPDPDILRCKELHIGAQQDALLFTYVDIGSEVRKQGAYRGAKVRWSKKKLTESYKSTTRKVTHKLEIQDNNQLLVTVKINPDKGVTRTYLQLFNRKPEANAPP
jgi:hypothetical protein